MSQTPSEASDRYAQRRDPGWNREETVIWLTMGLPEVELLFKALEGDETADGLGLRGELARIIEEVTVDASA